MPHYYGHFIFAQTKLMLINSFPYVNTSHTFLDHLENYRIFLTIASTTMTTFNIAELHQIAIAVFLVKTGKIIVTFTSPTPVFTLQLLLRQTIWLQPPFFSIVTWHLGHSCIRRILKMPVTTYNALKSEGKCYIKDFQRWKVN